MVTFIYAVLENIMFEGLKLYMKELLS